MKKLIKGIMFFVAMLALSGCYTTGLSVGERGNFNYANFIYSLYPEQGGDNSKMKGIQKPIKLAVAQVGENAPHKIMIEELTQERVLIQRIIPMPVGGEQQNYYGNNNQNDNSFIEKRTKQMRVLAKDLGADYIFLFGGSADYGTTPTWLQVFDITLVAGFIFPSNKISAEGRASGALIEVESGRVIFIVEAQDEKEFYAPTFIAYDKQQEIVVQLRDVLMDALAKKFVERLGSYN